MKEEYFWSVVIEEGSIQAAIWTIKDNAASVIATSNASSWEDDETLVTAADTCLSGCVQSLPENAAEPSRTVFGVPSSWVSEGQIERTKLDKIRLLCNKLSLNPTGFVVLPEAIAHFRKSEEKTQVSAVTIGVYPQSLDVSVFRFGNLSGTVNVARSLNIVDDVVEALVRFGVLDSLPSRVLLYDSKMSDLEEVKQNLVKADWHSLHEKVKFLHTPQIEIVNPEEKMAAVSLAGAAETHQASAIAFNFDKKEKEEKHDPDDNIEGVVDASTLGFAAGETIADKMPIAMPKVKLNLKLGKIGDVSKKVKQIFGNRQNFLKGNGAFLVALLGLIGVIIFLIVFWFVPKAQVNIIVAAKKIEGKERIIFDTKASGVDAGKRIIPAKLDDTTVSANKTKTTTGTKTVGTPAKGTVTFYNVGSSVNLPAGATLTGSGLTFALDNDLSVASASGAALPATANGAVTAKGVGADYNLASGTFFSIANYAATTLQAKNESDFSGGSSREVTAVAKDDIESLTADLLKQLTNDGKEDLKANVAGDNLLIDSSLIATPSAKEFDHKVGEEASTLKLSMSAKVSGLTISRKDINEIAKQIFAKQVSSGFVLEDEQIDFIFGEKETQFMINLLPKIDPDKIAEKIAGKSEAAAREILSQLPGYEDVQIKVTPTIPFLKFLPHVAHNISISLSAK